jgi:hypothetical protein
MTVNPMPQPVAASSVGPRHQQRPIKAAVASKPAKSSQPQQQPGRSLSMPDMSTYAAEAEEEKRLKRLARNRASARLRRLRKKNLVSAQSTVCMTHTMNVPVVRSLLNSGPSSRTIVTHCCNLR